MANTGQLVDNVVVDGVDKFEILPQNVRDYAVELSKDPARALDFMKRAGNLGEDGKLHPSFTDPNRKSMLY